MIDSTRVMTALKQCNLSSTMVAEGTGISMYSISKYRRGLAIPNGVNLVKLARYFNIPEVEEPEIKPSEYAEIIQRLTEQNQQLLSLLASSMRGELLPTTES